MDASFVKTFQSLILFKVNFKTENIGAGEDVSVIKNTGSSSRPTFHSQHPHGSSQLSLTLVQRPVFYFDLYKHHVSMLCTYIHADKIFIHVIKS